MDGQIRDGVRRHLAELAAVFSPRVSMRPCGIDIPGSATAALPMLGSMGALHRPASWLYVSDAEGWGAQ